jgi:predicted SAM-dependent methyltransferase
MFFEKETDLFNRRPQRMLHFAPEKQMSRRLAQVASLDYVTADIAENRAMKQLDITSISEPDDSFDVVYCSHVLEHVTEDRQAMAELFRILRPGGWALLLVPIQGEVTYEDASIQTPEARREAFDQEDHVRIYGRDFQQRLTQAGFLVEEHDYARQFDAEDRHRFGLDESDLIYRCHKPAGT